LSLGIDVLEVPMCRESHVHELLQLAPRGHELFVEVGSNTLEVETLGPLTRIEPGAHADHPESWLLTRVDCGPNDADIDAQLLPPVRDLSSAS
jgi:hypothetical protein